jgi:hypothetical protein
MTAQVFSVLGFFSAWISATCLQALSLFCTQPIPVFCEHVRMTDLFADRRSLPDALDDTRHRLRSRILMEFVLQDITQQTLLQSTAGDIVRLLRHQKLQELLEYVALTKTSMVLAALPEADSATWWIKDSSEWFYRTYQSPFAVEPVWRPTQYTNVP